MRAVSLIYFAYVSSHQFDTFDSQDARATAVHLIKDQASLALGAHAVVCRSNGGAYDAKEESRVLSVQPLPEQRAGVQTLKNRLPPIYAHLIRANLPGLKATTEDKLDAAQKQLERIGHQPLAPASMICECQTVLMGEFGRVEQQLTPSMKEFQEAIHATKDKITAEWVNEKLQENVFKCPFFQGEDALLCCLKDITEMWRPLVQNLIDSVEKHLKASMECVKTSTNGVSTTLSESILSKWAQEYGSLVADFRRECNLILDKERDFGTMNHYLVDKYAEEMFMPDQFVDDFLQNLTWDDLHQPVASSEATLQQTSDGPVHSKPTLGTVVTVIKELSASETS